MKNILIHTCKHLLSTIVLLFCFQELPAQNHLGHPLLMAQRALPSSLQQEPAHLPFLPAENQAGSQVIVVEALTTLEAFLIPLPLPQAHLRQFLLEGSLIVNGDGQLPSWMEYYSYDHSLKGMPPIGSEGSLVVELSFCSPNGFISYKLFLTVHPQSGGKPLEKEGLSYLMP